MIIIAATDDPNLDTIAINSAARARDTYGDIYKVFEHQIPPLGDEENLFIIAHGAYEGDEGGPVIGSATDDFYLTPMDTYQNLQSIFPNGYSGNVYIDACESATEESVVSFIVLLKTVLLDNGFDCRVFGREGLASGLIPLPGNPDWVEASL